ncbi:hypothetical protein FRB90_004089 [Tulasnella sp. 427]|nr:hypothetical protein FRB90_004089 [Tulasnella sp. 427]
MNLDNANSSDLSMTQPLNFHPQFSFPDGDLVFSASIPGQDAEKTYFRVHKPMLRLHSSTFSDMLDMPQGTEPGSEVVHLYDNSGAVAELLTVIYYPDKITLQPLRRACLDSAQKVLPLADKYDMPRITNVFLPRVKNDWPKTLARWDLNEAQIKLISNYIEHRRYTEGDDDAGYVDDVVVEPCSAIQIGKNLPLPQILPAAFYHLSRIPPINDEINDERYWEHLIRGGRTADWEMLSPDDYLILIRGKSEIRTWVHRFATRDGEAYWKAKSHETRDDCEGYAWWDRQMIPHFLDLFLGDELDVLEAFATLKKRFSENYRANRVDFTLCSSCLYRLSPLFDRKREEFWSDLPKFFGLAVPGWLEEDETVHI